MPSLQDINPENSVLWAPNGNVYPGVGEFRDALRFYHGELMRNGAGGGLAQLAASRASDPAGQAYQGAGGGFAPAGNGFGSEFAGNQFADLLNGQRGGMAAGADTQSKVREHATHGVSDIASGYANSITGAIKGDLALKQAQQAQGGDILSQIMGGLQSAGGIASEFVAPGNPMGINMALGGAGSMMGRGGAGMGSIGSGGMGQMFGNTGPFSNLWGSPTSSMSSLPPGYTPAGASTFASSSLPPWLDPSMIDSYSGAM